MVKFKQIPGQGGPSSSLGIMRFFDADVGGPKLSPEFILGLALAFVVIVLAMHLFG